MLLPPVTAPIVAQDDEGYCINYVTKAVLSDEVVVGNTAAIIGALVVFITSTYTTILSIR